MQMQVRNAAMMAVVACVASLAMPASAKELAVRNTVRAGSGPATEWIGYVGYNGRAFRSASTSATESGAKALAAIVCARAVLRECEVDDGHAIALPVGSDTSIAIARCQVGASFGTFLGASVVDFGGASWLALDKARKAGYSARSCDVSQVVDD